MGKMAKVKGGVKGVMNHRVRFGLFTVPLWVVAAAWAGRKLMERRRRYA